MLAYKILHHPVFYVFDLLLCIMLMLLALIERPAVFANGPDDNKLVVNVSKTYWWKRANETFT